MKELDSLVLPVSKFLLSEKEGSLGWFLLDSQ